MKILAIDTSTMISNVAILEDNKILGDYSVNQEKTHSESLLPMTEDLLKKLGLDMKDIDAFAIAKGPGSFTGLRIGMTATKTLAQMLDKKIVGVSTLEALAYGIMTDHLIMPVIDARGKRLFTGVYRWEGKKLVNVVADSMVNFQGFESFLEDHKDEKIILVGEATSLLTDIYEKYEKVEVSHAGLNNCIARNICILARDMLEEGLEDSYYDLSPNYLRKSQAELDYKKKHDK